MDGRSELLQLLSPAQLRELSEVPGELSAVVGGVRIMCGGISMLHDEPFLLKEKNLGVGNIHYSYLLAKIWRQSQRKGSAQPPVRK